MEKEELKEKDLSKLVGGYEALTDLISINTMSLDRLKLDDKEYNLLKELKYIENSQRDGEDYEYISRDKLGKIFDLLNKKFKDSATSKDLKHSIKIDF